MSIDVRARITCSLGTLISASLSDDYIQGSGLIKTSGSCEINGLVSPKLGQIVTFSYTKSGITRNVPRKLRVLSSFADPFRRTTQVELGCKLTYLQDLREPFKFRSEDDPDNIEIEGPKVVTSPVSAKAIAEKCLEQLGISTTSAVPLTNQFSVAEFDLGSGYVQVLSDLLVSESYCGYLNLNERLVIFSLDQEGGGGPVLGFDKLIDIGPIGIGQLPGDAVFVNYSTLKLKAADGEEFDEDALSFFDIDVVATYSITSVLISYTKEDGDQATREYQSLVSTREETQYRLIAITGDSSIAPFLLSGRTNDPRNPIIEYKRVVSLRKVTTSRSAVDVIGAYTSAVLSAGKTFSNYSVSDRTIEQFVYNGNGDEVFRSLRKSGDKEYGIGLLSVPMEFEGIPIAIPGGEMPLEEIDVSTFTSGNFKQTITKRFGPWAATISGQQSIAESRDSFQSIGQVNDYISRALSPSGTYLIDYTANTERSSGGTQEAPLEEDEINSRLADGGDPNNGFRTESVAETQVSTGDPDAQRRIEFSMPYAPDDVFIPKLVQGSDPPSYTYTAKTSDAQVKALTFGRVQNRMLLGNRNGMNIQVSPEVLPNEPFGPFYVSANGTTTQYRTNGTSWTMDSTGIVCSTDAMYWGVAGKSS
jgi:hypothetical protein